MEQQLMQDSSQIYLVATEGGGSRAGAWTAAVLTGLDKAMGGKFQQQCFAISGISGGSIGAASVLSWWDNAQQLQIQPNQLYANDTARTRYIGRVFKRNYISSSLAGIFFYDGFQHNALFSWMYPRQLSRTDRLQEEEADAVRLAMLDVFGEKACSRLRSNYLKETDFLGLYYQNNNGIPKIGLPLFFPNTCRVEEGRRGICSPVLLNSNTSSKGAKYPGNPGLIDIVEAKDKAGQTSMRLSLGEATSLSELFPFINSTVHMGESVGTFMDGGVYENMGLTTLYEIRSALKAVQAAPDTALIRQLFPDDARARRFLAFIKNVRFKLVLIYNTEHLDHDLNPHRSRTVQFLDPITTLLHTPFGGHTDYVYHKTKNDFGDSNVVEFPLLLLEDFALSAKYSRKPSDPIVMSRWLSNYEMAVIMERAEKRVKERMVEMGR
jgi:hypothetical protein